METIANHIVIVILQLSDTITILQLHHNLQHYYKRQCNIANTQRRNNITITLQSAERNDRHEKRREVRKKKKKKDPSHIEGRLRTRKFLPKVARCCPRNNELSLRETKICIYHTSKISRVKLCYNFSTEPTKSNFNLRIRIRRNGDSEEGSPQIIH